MLTFAQFQKLQVEGVPKISGGAFPAHMNVMARAKALRSKVQGEWKAAQRAAAQRVATKAKAAGTYPVSALDQPQKTKVK